MQGISGGSICIRLCYRSRYSCAGTFAARLVTSGMTGKGGTEADWLRQPEAKADIIQTMILGQAVAETSGIYGLIIAIIILLIVRPLAQAL